MTLTSLKQLNNKLIQSKMIRFIIVGGINTITSYVLYLFFLMFMSYNVAYIITFFLTVFMSYLFNLRFVFKQKHSMQKMMQFPLVYGFQLLFGIFALNFLVGYLGVNSKIAPLIIVALTTPITFVMARFVIGITPEVQRL